MSEFVVFKQYFVELSNTSNINNQNNENTLHVKVFRSTDDDEFEYQLRIRKPSEGMKKISKMGLSGLLKNGLSCIVCGFYDIDPNCKLCFQICLVVVIVVLCM